jgi:transcription antitermination protein NusB
VKRKTGPIGSGFFLEEDPMSRRTAREKAVQALFECEFHPERVEEVIVSRGEELHGADLEFYFRLARGVRGRLELLDPLLQRFLKKGWSLERISTVDRAILRLAAYELMCERETPPAAVLNEAVELAKMFSGEQSGRFINGVLGSIANSLDSLIREWDEREAAQRGQHGLE